MFRHKKMYIERDEIHPNVFEELIIAGTIGQLFEKVFVLHKETDWENIDIEIEGQDKHHKDNVSHTVCYREENCTPVDEGCGLDQ